MLRSNGSRTQSPLEIPPPPESQQPALLYTSSARERKGMPHSEPPMRAAGDAYPADIPHL